MRQLHCVDSFGRIIGRWRFIQPPGRWGWKFQGSNHVVGSPGHQPSSGAFTGAAAVTLSADEGVLAWRRGGRHLRAVYFSSRHTAFLSGGTTNFRHRNPRAGSLTDLESWCSEGLPRTPQVSASVSPTASVPEGPRSLPLHGAPPEPAFLLHPEPLLSPPPPPGPVPCAPQGQHRAPPMGSCLSDSDLD